MSLVAARPVPGWQTEELQDEWVELEPEETADDENDNGNETRSISFTAPLATEILMHSNISDSQSSTSSHAVGTFLVREDVQNSPFLPKTPARNKKNMIKDFFTPLPLETMFEPPTPPETKSSRSLAPLPTIISHGSQEEIVETDMPHMSSFHRRKPSMACKFTFSIPRDGTSNQKTLTSVPLPQGQCTPNPLLTPHAPPPATDPRLRLFQFQYDTYTRDHLSAMVDSIAVNTPSGSATGTTPSPTNCYPALSHVSEVTSSNVSHLRSAKRVKLSPHNDLYGEGAGAGASISRPKLTVKDYVGESRSLMQQIKQARDFSTISTVASGQRGSPIGSTNHVDEDDCHPGEATNPSDSSRRPSFLAVPSNDASNPPSSASTVRSQNSSSTKYRQQAAELMAQIKNDMKGQKRLFSSETTASRTSQSGDDKVLPHKRLPSLGNSTSRQHFSLNSSNSSYAASLRQSLNHSASANGVDRLTNSISRMSVEDAALQQNAAAQFTRSVSSSQNSRPPSRQHNSLRGSTAPSYPSSSLRNGVTEDLNRFVSSSTASGTTLTAGSAPSFVKHAGPAHIRTIAPGDIPTLPDRLGDMVFDKVTMKWVKANVYRDGGGGETGSTTGVSEDPFGDIESLRDDTIPEMELTQDVSQVTEDDGLSAMSRIEEQSEVDDEEMELTSFSTDASMRVMHMVTGVEDDEYGNEQERMTDSEEEGYDRAQAEQGDVHKGSLDTFEEISQHAEADDPGTVQSPHPQQSLQAPAPSININTPARPGRSLSATTPVIRSAMKSTSVTPASVLKNSINKLQTPLQKNHRRSVSFSDGKRDGPIRGLNTSKVDNPGTTNGTFVQSVRSKRIADMIDALEDSESDFENESPSKTSSSGRSDDMRPLTERRPMRLANGNSDGSRSRVFSGSYGAQPSTGGQTGNNANGTFLTECSFGVAHDRLVQVITDVHPFEPHWDELGSIDLSNKKIESVARLKEFLPQLDALNLNSNQLSWLSGIPGSVRTLSVAFNCLTGLTSYSHLTNLENLDISRNEVESLRQLACLRHLHELKADGNRITSLEGLERMDGLVKLSLQGNSITAVDFEQFIWTRLEMLNMSQNRLDNVQGLVSLQSLIALNLDNNVLAELGSEGQLPRLRILRVSGNRLQELNAASFPNLRTLYADNNSLVNLVKLDRLNKLENLSLRNQRGRGLNLLTRDVRDVKRLYLSGNAIKSGFFEEHCYNLVYLEMAACRLTALPEELALLVPNLRVLNLNYNFLEDVRPLEGLVRLKKLTIIGSRLKGTKALIRLLQRMPDVEMLDFRMNPCTLGWYLPLLVRDVPGALQPSEGRGGRGGGEGGGWQELDSKFRRDLPDETYIGRLAYRGLVMQACPKIRMLDGVEMSEKERRKAQVLLQGILGRRGGRGGRG
ncbi:hypothetical protein AX17_005182 [Amanita inopinata Kibby_2008]|nr:hypothetical protein AX17_005182 [Amanita inopinata Kibby_2008]